MCKIVLETDTVTCSNDQTTCKINHKFECNEECLVYVITCNKFLKEFIGQTEDMIRSRWNYITIKLILGNSIEERTILFKDTFKNISATRSY